MAKFLFLECKYGLNDELWFASCWAKEIANAIRQLGHEVIEIESPSVEVANTTIAEYKPDVTWHASHGYCCTNSLEKLEIWISTPLNKCYVLGEPEKGCKLEQYEDVFSGMVINALSCLTGQYLARHLTMHHGCIAYLGYIDLFFLNYMEGCACGCIIPGVRNEVIAASFICTVDANLHFCLGLAVGMSIREAYEYSLQRFNEWIE